MKIRQIIFVQNVSKHVHLVLVRPKANARNVGKVISFKSHQHAQQHAHKAFIIITSLKNVIDVMNYVLDAKIKLLFALNVYQEYFQMLVKKLVLKHAQLAGMEIFLKSFVNLAINPVVNATGMVIIVALVVTQDIIQNNHLVYSSARICFLKMAKVKK